MCLVETISIVIDQSIKLKKTASKLEVWKTARWLNEEFFAQSKIWPSHISPNI
jgi:hypothetical protein